MLLLLIGGVERILNEHDKVLLINNCDQETVQGANTPSFLLNIAHTYAHKHKGERVQSSSLVTYLLFFSLNWETGS